MTRADQSVQNAHTCQVAWVAADCCTMRSRCAPRPFGNATIEALHRHTERSNNALKMLETRLRSVALPLVDSRRRYADNIS